MADIATLGLKVDSTDVKGARDELGRFKSAAKEAETGSATFGANVKAHFGIVKEAASNLIPVLGTLGIAIGAIKIGEFVADVIHAGSEAQQAMTRLNAILAATGNTTGLLRQDLEDLAVAVEKTTVFDDEKARRAIAALAVFDQVSGTVFKRTIKDAGDFATLMGSDLPDAAETLGRALQNPAENLTQLNRGMKLFSDSQIEAIKQTQKMEGVAAAQAVVLDRLESKTRGLAAAQKETLVGTTASLANAWDDFKETLANSSGIISTVTGLVEGLTRAVEGLDSILREAPAKSFDQKITDEIALIQNYQDMRTRFGGLSDVLIDQDQVTKNIEHEREKLHELVMERKEETVAMAAARAEAEKRAAAAKAQAVADQAAAELQKQKEQAEKEAAAAAAAAAKQAKKDHDDAVTSLTDQIAGLKDERDQLAMTDQQKFVHNQLLKAEAEIKKGGLSDGQKYLDQIQAEATLTATAIAQKKASAEIDKAIEEDRKKTADEQQRMAEQAAEDMQKPFDNAIEAIQTDFGTFFKNVLHDGIGSFTDLSSSIKGIMQDLVGDLAAMLVIKPIIQPILNRGMGGGGLGSPTTQGAGGLLSGLNFSDLFAAPTNGQPMPGTIGPPTASQSAGGLFGGGFSAMGAGLSVVASIGDIINGLHPSGPGSNYGQLGQGIGGAIGGIAGSFFGPVGGMVGQMLGSMLGGIVGGLVKGPNNYPKAAAYFSVGDEGVFAGPGVRTDNGGDAATASVFQKPTVQLFRGLLSQLNGKFGTGQDYGYLLGQDVLGGIQNKAGVFNAVVGKNVFSNLGSQENAVATFVAESLKAGLKAGSLTGLSETMTEVFKKANVRTAQELQDVLDFGTFYEQLKEGKKDVTDAETAIKALNLQFAAMKDKAKELGLATDVIDQGLTDAIKKLTTDFNTGVSDQILAITDPMQLALKQLADAQAKRVAEATKLGADLVEVEKLNALERQKVVEQYVGQATKSLTAFYQQLTYGNLSGANPVEGLAGARATFNAAAAMASAGNVDAINNIQGYGQAYLSASQAVNASGAGYFADLANVTSVVGNLIGAQPQSLASVMQTGNTEIARLLSANNDEIEQLRRITEQQASMIEQLTNQLARFISAQAA